MSESQETRKPNRFRITSIIIAIAIIGLMLGSSLGILMSPSNVGSPLISNDRPVKSQTLISPDGSEVATIMSETFDDMPTDWIITKTGGNVIANITNGEFEIRFDGANYATVYFPANISKQDYTMSFNYRLADDLNPGQNPPIMWPESGLYKEDDPVVYDTVGWMIIQNSGLPNNSAKIYYDDGTKLYPNYNALTHLSPAIDRLVNYQFTIQCWGWNDSMRVQIYNKSSSSYLYDRVWNTFATHTPGNTIRPIPDRFFFGNLNHAWYDNITITQERGVHVGATFSNALAQSVINNMGAEMLTVKYSSSPAKYRLAWDLTNYWSFYSPVALQPNVLTNTRDDVSGELIEMLAMLYEYTGDTQYLDLAEEMWPVLLTHRQPDGGWTFGTTISDYSDTNARIIQGLLALYRVTGNEQYLLHAEVSLANLVNYVDTSGIVWGNIARPNTYSGVTIWFNAHAIVALLDGYEYTGTQIYYDKAVLALSYIMQRQTWSGRITSLAYGNGGPNAEYNDVSETGSALWALSEAYKHTGNIIYLQKADLAATYLRNSEFTKNGNAYGLWAGLQDDRLNQSNLLYNWPIYMGLSSYIDINPVAEIKSLLNYSLNSVAGMNGVNETVDSGRIIYEPDGVWGSAWNLNDTGNPGWSMGWWAEGGWGTWGYMAWFGWSGCLLKVLLKQIANADQSTIYLHSSAIIGPAGIWHQSASSPSETVSLAGTASLNVIVHVSEWISESRKWFGSASGIGTATFTLSGLESGRMYRLYIDGVSSNLLTASGSGVISFTYSGPWSEHQFEIVATSITGSISPLVNLIFIMFGIGIVVGVVGESVRTLRKEKVPKIDTLINMFIYIIIGIAGIGVLYSIVV